MLKETLPKVSCLMVTEGRPNHVKKSVQCFQNQTYKNKELIILSQGNDDVNAKILSLVKDMENVLFFDAPSRITLGALRNLSCETASGEILCQWDDDDLSFPNRIKDQLKALTSNSGNIVSACTRFFKYFSDTKDMYWCDWNGEKNNYAQVLSCTVMFYKSIFHHYNSSFYPESGLQCNKEEDMNVLHKMLSYGSMAKLKDGFQYVYQFHGENVYGRDHHRLTLRTDSGKVVANCEELFNNGDLISDNIKDFGLSDVKVRSLDKVAFTVK